MGKRNQESKAEKERRNKALKTESKIARKEKKINVWGVSMTKIYISAKLRFKPPPEPLEVSSRQPYLAIMLIIFVRKIPRTFLQQAMLMDTKRNARDIKLAKYGRGHCKHIHNR